MIHQCLRIWDTHFKFMGEKNLKILIADDEPDILSIEAKRLSAAGYAVVTASDGVEASQKIASQRPDIVVLDLNMPGKDGLSVLRELREKSPEGRWVPVIIVSARGELEVMRQGFDLQADHYIHKPCRPEDVVQAVKLMSSLIPLRN